jgi:4-hydroxy-tetrahydrodipicolinate reductase
MNIALIGYGSMGHSVERVARERGHSIVTIVNENHKGLDASHLSESLRAADVAIDFTAAPAVERNVSACMHAEVPLVEGTTGWHDDLDKIRSLVVNSGGALAYGANFSIGVNLFYKVIEYAAELFAKFPEYELFIEELHHSKKRDAPSGTALKLREIVDPHYAGDVSIASTRTGHIPGTHRVGFDAPADQILLEHSARSRDGFALGAVMAAEWLVGKKGLHEFTSIMDEITAGDTLV